MANPRRLPPGEYHGSGRYFLTICCAGRVRRFSDASTAALVVAQMLQTAAAYRVAVHAYCVMPDHLHLLCETDDDSPSFPSFVHMLKQRSAHLFARDNGERLWQRSYFDWKLRRDEDLLRVARYVLANPVRAGLVERPEDYPHSGSGTMTMEELLGSLV